MPKGNWKEVGILVSSSWKNVFKNYTWSRHYSRANYYRPITTVACCNILTKQKRYLQFSAGQLVGKVLGIALVDHKNGNPFDNRLSNIRTCTISENMRNKANNKGYSWYKACKKYIAYITVNKKRIHLGYFKNKKDARNAYIKAAKKAKVFKFLRKV